MGHGHWYAELGAGAGEAVSRNLVPEAGSGGCDCPGIAVAGRYAFAADYASGLAVIDLSGE